MNLLELKVGQMLKGADVAQWEILDPDYPVEAARAWVLARATREERDDQESKTSLFLYGSSDAGDRGAIVVHAPKRDVQMALAIHRRGDTFLLRGHRNVFRVPVVRRG